MRKKRIIMARLTPLKDAGRKFDVAFWDKVGAEGRFAAALEMVREVYAMKHEGRELPRLDRAKVRLIPAPWCKRPAKAGSRNR